MAKKKKEQTATLTDNQIVFYKELLKFLNTLKTPFRVGGTCAVNEYIGLERETKDLDIFCRTGDYLRILTACADAGFETEIEDERWIGKVRRGPLYCDVIFGSANMAAPITDAWLREKFHATFWGIPVLLLPPTELIWSKVFIVDRYKFDGNDIAHLILRQHEHIDWKRLLSYMEQHWEVLLLHILLFRYAYPSERRIIPGWLMDELTERLAAQRQLPIPQTRVCRGRIFSRADYRIDVNKWGFVDLVGEQIKNGRK